MILQGDMAVFAGRLLLAALLGGLIGLEREYHGRDAGFRTHLLVSMGACLMVFISEYFYLRFGAEPATGILRLDPTRIAAQIVTGIGFLGAGAILREGLSVRGLTTAACLWLVAGLGMAVGVGLYFPAFFATLLSLLTLWVLKKVERRVRRGSFRILTIHCSAEDGTLEKLRVFLGEKKIDIFDFSLERDLMSREMKVDLTVRVRPETQTIIPLMESVAALEYVKKVILR
ncbi:MAG: MgtC/SapB family protein [Desulfuromonadaceae bacterium]|nr:MgtC/SapB family protein [Desulfuromonadaceae bacterium]